MAGNESIFFKESEERAVDFLHELNDPDLVRPTEIPAGVAAQLRSEQIAKLEENIAVLRKKQEEFNRKMEEYISNLQRLIESLHPDAEGALAEYLGSTSVRCMGCSSEKTFTDLCIIFARESDDALTSPTQCYVSDKGQIKKGLFECRECGSESLLIQAR